MVALSHLVVQYESNFCTVALQFMEEEKNYAPPSPAAPGAVNIFFKVKKSLRSFFCGPGRGTAVVDIAGKCLI